MTGGVQITAGALSAALARLCPAAGIDLAGAVALPCALPHAAQWRAWLNSGRHAGLEYLARDPEGRADPTRASPWAGSLLVFAQHYTCGWSADERRPFAGADRGRPWTDGVARYARGQDYHDVLARAVEAVLSGLRRTCQGLRAHAAVDTGPYLEREYAWLAGLGFFGKNSCLIHERLGSGLFLAVALTNLHVRDLPAPGAPASEPLYGVLPRARRARQEAIATRCGHCTRCLEACPTGALDAPFRLDANRCIATWTIEWHGKAPAADRAAQGALLFGCDICQAVCPWNHKAAHGDLPAPAAAYEVLGEHGEIRLADLIGQDVQGFRRRFRRTPLWRAHPEGMRRNALTVAANSGRAELVPEIERLAATDADADVRAVARWALARLGEDTGPAPKG